MQNLTPETGLQTRDHHPYRPRVLKTSISGGDEYTVAFVVLLGKEKPGFLELLYFIFL